MVSTFRWPSAVGQAVDFDTNACHRVISSPLVEEAEVQEVMTRTRKTRRFVGDGETSTSWHAHIL
jgi:hypothetical protein